MNSLSVVIISKNEEAHIAGCLQSVLAAAEEIGGAEVVVADSASTDRTAEIARSLGVRVLSLRPEWELSPAAGRYVGFHHTQGDLVMFVDADTVIDREWFRLAMPYFEQPEVAGVTGYLDDVDEAGNPLPYVGKRSTHVRPTAWLRGSGLYRRAAMEQVGTFNPYLITEEESELGVRLRRRGLKLLQVPHPMGCHMRGTSTPSFLVRSWRLGRVRGTGRALRYACHAGNGLRFGIARFLTTLCFIMACLSLALGSALFLNGKPFAAEATLVPFIAGIIAIVIKKRSLLGPIHYAAHHGMILTGTLIGFFTTQVKDPRSYPLDILEEELPPYQPPACDQAFLNSRQMMEGNPL